MSLHITWIFCDEFCNLKAMLRWVLEMQLQWHWALKNAWSGIYFDWHKHHCSWQSSRNTRMAHDANGIVSPDREYHRCIHTILCFVNTAGGISLLALLVKYISDIADIHDGPGE